MNRPPVISLNTGFRSSGRVLFMPRHKAGMHDGEMRKCRTTLKKADTGGLVSLQPLRVSRS